MIFSSPRHELTFQHRFIQSVDWWHAYQKKPTRPHERNNPSLKRVSEGRERFQEAYGDGLPLALWASVLGSGGIK